MRVDGPAFRSSSDGAISRGGCTNISSLTNNAEYRFSVVAVSEREGAGETGSVTAFVGGATAGRNGWSCRGVASCHPSRPGLCSRSGCDAVQRGGQCRAPAMVDVDWVGKQARTRALRGAEGGGRGGARAVQCKRAM